MEYINFINEKYGQELYSTPIVLILLITGLIYIVITKLPDIFDAIDGIRHGKIKPLEQALESEYIDEELKESFKVLIINSYFRKVTGLKLEKPKREKLVKLHLFLKGEVSYAKLDKLEPYVMYNENDKNFVLSEKFKDFKTIDGLGTAILLLFGFAMGFVVYLNIEEAKAMQEHSLWYMHFILVGIPALSISLFFFYLAYRSILERKTLKLILEYIIEEKVE